MQTHPSEHLTAPNPLPGSREDSNQRASHVARHVGGPGWLSNCADDLSNGHLNRGALHLVTGCCRIGAVTGAFSVVASTIGRRGSIRLWLWRLGMFLLFVISCF